MIVRTYGRRNRSSNSLTRTYSDSILEEEEEEENDVVLGFNKHSFSEDNDVVLNSSSSQDLFAFPFSSEESTSLWNNDSDPFDFHNQENNTNGVVSRKSKKQKIGNNFDSNSNSRVFSTSTLMETQEFGEMIEHVDEVNFALDGLKKGQPVRIKRASLLSLLSICGTVQQRRLLRAQGLAKTIIDAILGLQFDDTSSNLAAATLFYVLTGDGQDDHLLELPSSIRFLIKLLKPVTSTAVGDKVQSFGSKLVGLRKDLDILKDATKLLDSTSASIAAKVQEILVSCKDVKSLREDDTGIKRPELNPKWVALLTMEKACLSKISFEDTSGMVRKTGGNFKEKLRELGGLDTVFEVAVNCHSTMESWKGLGSPTLQDRKDESRKESLVLLLKCLKIMENATFLSNDNQNHLLGMKGKLDSYGCRLSFTKLIISVIKILSGLYMHKSSASSSDEGKSCMPSDLGHHSSALALIADHRDSNEVISISSSTNFSCSERTCSQKKHDKSQKVISQYGFSSSSSDTADAAMSDAFQLTMRIHSSSSSSCSGTIGSSNNGAPFAGNGLRTKFRLSERTNCTKSTSYDDLEDSLDPYAFGEDDFQPSKWDLMSGKQKKSRPRNRGVKSRAPADECQLLLRSQEETSNGENSQQKSRDMEHDLSQKNSGSNVSAEEYFSLIGDCLLTAVKVLMNLTNENPIGCKQIANCGGLETMSSLIAGHFPPFSLSLSSSGGSKEDTSSTEPKNQNDNHLTDQELDFLVAILGLLVNLVEKDGHNRSRLAAITVSEPSSQGSYEVSGKDVIPLLCSIFLANQGAGDASGEGNAGTWNDEDVLLQGEKEAEKMIVEAYAALLLAFLSTESKSIRDSIADCLPNHSLAILVPVLERFVAFHLTLNMISPETHKTVNEVIESCRIP